MCTCLHHHARLGAPVSRGIPKFMSVCSCDAFARSTHVDPCPRLVSGSLSGVHIVTGTSLRVSSSAPCVSAWCACVSSTNTWDGVEEVWSLNPPAAHSLYKHARPPRRQPPPPPILAHAVHAFPSASPAVSIYSVDPVSTVSAPTAAPAALLLHLLPSCTQAYVSLLLMCSSPLHCAARPGAEDFGGQAMVVEFRGANEQDIAQFPAFVFKKSQVDQLPLHGKEVDDLKVSSSLQHCCQAPCFMCDHSACDCIMPATPPVCLY